MKTTLLVLVAVITLSLSAQAVWQDDVIVRKQDRIDWNNNLAKTSDGGHIVVWINGDYGIKGVYAHRTNALGEAVWESDVLLSDSEYLKWEMQIITTADGCFVISWHETQNTTTRYYATKINTDGQFVWNPQLKVIAENSESLLTARLQADDSGGLYMAYTKMITATSANIYIQHLSASGEPLLPEDGVELTHETTNESILGLSLAADNSLILIYNTSNGTVASLKAQRMLPTHQQAWTVPTLIHTVTGSIGMYETELMTMNASEFVLNWVDNISNTTHTYIQKLDLAGNLLFPDFTLVAANKTVWMAMNSTGEMFATIHSGSNNGPMTSAINKFTANGVPLWGTGIALPDSVWLMKNPIPDANGGCFVVQQYLQNYETNEIGFAMQHVDSNGALLLGAGGITVISDLSQVISFGTAFSFTDRFHFFWIEHWQNRQGLYTQVRNVNGQLMSSPRITIRDGIAGKAINVRSIARANDVLVYWIDFRNMESHEPYTLEIYFQTVNPDGSVDMTPDGALLVDNLDYSYPDIKAVNLANGNTVFIWVDNVNGAPRIMGQCVNPTGSVIWEPGGRILSTLAGQYITIPELWAAGNDVYLAFSRSASYDSTGTVVQKITDGQAMWGAGIAISSHLPDLSTQEIPVEFKDGFLVLAGYLQEPEQVFLWATHLEPNGTTTPGWQQGVLLASEQPLSPGYMQPPGMQSESFIANGNLFVAFRLFQSGVYNYIYSVLTPDATLMVNQQPMLDDDTQELDLWLDTTTDIAMVFNQYRWQENTMSLAYGKMTTSGTYPWTNIPQVVSEATTNEGVDFPQIHGYGDGAYVMLWSMNDKIYGGYINSLGDYQSPLGGELLVSQCANQPQVSRLDNHLYITWEDYSNTLHSDWGSAVSIQKYANPTTGNLDDHLPVLTHNLSCYPNPFQASLNVRFEAAEKGKTTLSIYNIKGQKVRTLLHAASVKGTNAQVWNGRDDKGRQVASGVYYLRLDSGKTSANTKVLYLK